MNQEGARVWAAMLVIQTQMSRNDLAYKYSVQSTGYKCRIIPDAFFLFIQYPLIIRWECRVVANSSTIISVQALSINQSPAGPAR